MKKHYTPATCNQAIYSLIRAPPFFSCMIDIAGTFKAHDSVKRRVTKEVYFLIQVCLVTGAVAIRALEDLSTSSVVMALKRFTARYGWSKYIILDNQSSIKCLHLFKDFCFWSVKPPIEERVNNIKWHDQKSDSPFKYSMWVPTLQIHISKFSLDGVTILHIIYDMSKK